MNKTSIEWTDTTWNPIRGCRRTAPAGSRQSGCGDPTGGGCYAERQAARFCGPGQPYEGLITLTANGPRWSGRTRFVSERLADPMRWRKPRRIFVDSMSDLFYEGFTDEEIAAVFGVMVLAGQHTYQVLTKRPARMRDWFSRWTVDACLDVLARVTTPSGESIPGPRAWNHPPHQEWYGVDRWPVPWIWLGVSVENQAAADERIPELLRTPAAVRFLSCEPLLDRIDLARVAQRRTDSGIGMQSWERIDALAGARFAQSHGGPWIWNGLRGPRVDWVIAGSESGTGSRPCGVEWLRLLRDRCAANAVPFLLKQAKEAALAAGTCTSNEPVAGGPGSHRKPGGVIGAPYLDGVRHLAFPEVRRG